MDQDDDIVFLSIHETWAEKILNGEKEFEYRRIAPNRKPPYFVLLYATNGSGAIIGEAKIDHVVKDNIDNLIKRTLNKTPHGTNEIEEYFRGSDVGHALHIAKASRYDEPILLSKLQKIDPEFSPPQNFRYLIPSKHAELLEVIPSYSETSSQRRFTEFE